MSTRANVKLILLGLMLCLLLVALPAYAQDSTAEVTGEATNTSEPVATWTPESASEATVEIEATNTSEAVATWTPDASAATAEATEAVTTEVTAEPTAEPTAEVTVEATPEAAPETTATVTPEAEEEAEPVGGLSTLMLLIGVGAVAAVGGVAMMRERGGRI